jgi:hypothetical protein
MPANIMREVKEELSEIGRDLQGKSVIAAPIDTGALRGSAFHTVHFADTGLTLIVGFQGLPYIIVQHEKGWLNFMGEYGPKDIERYHGGGGEKFLERPWLENKARYQRAIAGAVRRGVRD